MFKMTTSINSIDNLTVSKAINKLLLDIVNIPPSSNFSLDSSLQHFNYFLVYYYNKTLLLRHPQRRSSNGRKSVDLVSYSLYHLLSMHLVVRRRIKNLKLFFLQLFDPTYLLVEEIQCASFIKSVFYGPWIVAIL